MKGKKLIIVALVGVILIVAAVFLIVERPSVEPVAERPAEPAVKEVPVYEQPFELSVAWWGGAARHERKLAMIEAYMDEFPNATIISQYATFGDYWTQMAVLAAADDLPDTFMVQLMYLAQYATEGFIRPLQDLIDTGKIDVTNFTPGALSASSIGGSLYGITMGDTASVVVFNKTLIESVNHPLPWDQMTHTEKAEYLKSLAEILPDGYFAAALGARHEHIIENFARQKGMPGVITADGKSIGYTREMLSEFLNFHLSLYEAGVYPPMEVILEDRPKVWADSLAGQGRIAYWFTNVNQGKIFQAGLPDNELGMVRSPVVDNAVVRNAEVGVCSTWTISANSEKVYQAAHFINEMVNNWDLQKIYDMDIGVPGSTVIQQKLIDNLDLTNRVDAMKKREIVLMREILGSIAPFDGRPAGFALIIDNLYRMIDEVLLGRMTVDQAVETHFNEVEALLN